MCAEANITRRQDTQQGAEIEATRPRTVFLPHTDIYERQDAIVVVAEMPGVKRDDVDINLQNSELTITGRAQEERVEGHELSYAEYETGDYERKFRISAAIDADKIDASMKNGVLRVVLPKSKETLPRKVEVKAQ
jgi:HSP20 family protein